MIMKKIITTSTFFISLLWAVPAKAQLASSQPVAPAIGKQTTPKAEARPAEMQTASATAPVYAKPATKPANDQAATSEQIKMKEPAPKPANKTAALKPGEQKKEN